MSAAVAARCPICREPSGIDARGLPTFECPRSHSWWQPWPGPQTRFLSLTCFEACYGGAAGGGKSDALLIDAVRYIGRGYGPAYHALLLRRTFPEVKKSLIIRSKALYPRLGARYNKTDHVWTFPGGELVEFGHVQHEDDVERYQGGAFPYVGFDELTTFTKYQYLYLFSRCRSAVGIPCRIRGATNPGGEGHEWAFERFGPWLDTRDEYVGPRAGPGEVLYFVRDDERERVTQKSDPRAKGRTFVPAQLEDNPSLFVDGKYEAALEELDKVTYERLRRSNWLIQPGKGMYFKRAYFADRFVDSAPVGPDVRRVRYWDRAATVDGDWTVGLKLSETRDKVIFVEDIVRFRGDPGVVEASIRTTASLDGEGVRQCLEQDPGAAGKAEINYLIRGLDGFDARAVPKRVNKVVAAGPISSRCEHGAVRIVRARWNEAFIAELEAFPEGSYDDQVDAFSGAYTALLAMPVPTGRKPKPPRIGTRDPSLDPLG